MPITTERPTLTPSLDFDAIPEREAQIEALRRSLAAVVDEQALLVRDVIQHELQGSKLLSNAHFQSKLNQAIEERSPLLAFTAE